MHRTYEMSFTSRNQSGDSLNFISKSSRDWLQKSIRYFVSFFYQSRNLKLYRAAFFFDSCFLHSMFDVILHAIFILPHELFSY